MRNRDGRRFNRKRFVSHGHSLGGKLDISARGLHSGWGMSTVRGLALSPAPPLGKTHLHALWRAAAIPNLALGQLDPNRLRNQPQSWTQAAMPRHPLVSNQVLYSLKRREMERYMLPTAICEFSCSGGAPPTDENGFHRLMVRQAHHERLGSRSS